MCLNLKDGALLIADAHYPNHKKEQFLKLLKLIDSKELQVTQLILMGDIFDLLVGNSPYLKNRFSKEIALLESIATNIEVIYLEGNHDFYLKPLFKNVKVIPIKKQPLLAKLGSKSISLSHGDRYLMSLSYKIFTKIIRAPITLKLLPDLVAKKKLKSMSKKVLCRDILNFKAKVLSIKKHYKSDIIVEGHYHQGVILDNYYALPSFACNEGFAMVENGKIIYKKIKDII